MTRCFPVSALSLGVPVDGGSCHWGRAVRRAAASPCVQLGCATSREARKCGLAVGRKWKGFFGEKLAGEEGGLGGCGIRVSAQPGHLPGTGGGPRTPKGTEEPRATGCFTYSFIFPNIFFIFLIVFCFLFFDIVRLLSFFLSFFSFFLFFLSFLSFFLFLSFSLSPSHPPSLSLSLFLSFFLSTKLVGSQFPGWRSGPSACGGSSESKLLD